MAHMNQFRSHRAVLPAVIALGLAIGAPASSQAFRYTFAGDVTVVVNPDNYAIDTPVGVKPGEEVLYSIVIDFGRSGRLDSLMNPATRFADWLAGEHMGPSDATCTTFATFPAIGLPEWETEVNFVNGEFIFLGSPRNTLFLRVIGLDGTPESLQVDVTTIQAVELVCDLFGQGPANIISALTLREIVPVGNSDGAGGVGNIVGRVTDFNSGDPINCAAVTAFSGDGPQAVAVTNEDGDYLIQGLGFASYTIEVFAPEYVGQTVSLTLGKLQDVANFELAMGEADGVITGTVSDGDTGAPLAGVRIDAIQGLEFLVTTFTCASGFYELRNLNTKGGVVTVAASAPSYEFEAASVTIGDENNVSLNKSFIPGTITGTIRDAGGDGIDGATVSTVHTVLNVGPTTATNEDGLYVSSPLADGLYSVNISKPGFISVTINQEVSGNVVTANENLEVGNSEEPGPIEGTGETKGGCSGGATIGNVSVMDWTGRGGDISLVAAAVLVLVWRGRRTRPLQLGDAGK